MKIEIKIPSMGESITEVTIGNILISSGTVVKADAEILELETDKVNQTLYAPQGGALSLNVQAGETVKIGQVIGTIDSEEQSVPVEEKPSIPPKEEIKYIEEIPQITTEVKQSPGGRVSKEKFIQDLQHPPIPAKEISSKAEPQASASETPLRETRQKMSTIRKVIAKRLVEVQQSVAMLTTFNEVDLSQVIQMRESYKDYFIQQTGVKLGFMSFFVKACVLALKAFPHLNSYIDGEEIVRRDYYDIGIAVGGKKGLIVPVIRDCDRLTFVEIEKTIDEFLKKIEEGSIAVNELQGGGFTITNGGVYGSLLSTPILSPSQSGILGMHKIEKRPVVIDDQIVIRPMMYVALSYDHRLVDGKEAISFLVHIKNVLEDPSRMLLGIH